MLSPDKLMQIPARLRGKTVMLGLCDVQDVGELMGKRWFYKIASIMSLNKNFEM